MDVKASESLLQVNNLSVHFSTDRGTVKAVDQAALAVKKAEVVGLIGESGSGKTTVARSVLRVLPPSARLASGSIFFSGMNIVEMKERELNTLVRGKGITLIPQDPFNSLNPVFPVGTQIRDILKWKLGMKKDKQMEERICEMLEKVQIPSPMDQLKKYPHQFSGGQRQRLMVAMALLPGPELVIADEPTTALDVTVEAQILRLMMELVVGRGVSVLFITHDLGVASQISNRVVVMYAGQDMENAASDVIFADPHHPYTWELLQSLPNPKGEIRDIPGEVPNLVKPPTGCRFHPRCSRASQECSLQIPKKLTVGQDHWVRCFHPLG